MKIAAVVASAALATTVAAANSGALSYTEFLQKKKIAESLANDPESFIKPLILSGTEVPVGQKAWTSGLRQTKSGTDFCGGTLITPTHVLTAAHCFGSIKYVSVGTHFLSGTKDGEQIAVKKQTKHPKNNADTMVYDFLMLELATASKVKPIALKASEPAVGVVSNVAGWGTTSSGGSQSKVLLEVDVPIVSDAVCGAKLQIDNDTMICAGGEADKDSCQGDSGGPLTVKINGTSEDALVGVVSWGEGCGMVGYPGVYAQLSVAKDWIDATVKAAGQTVTWVE